MSIKLCQGDLLYVYIEGIKTCVKVTKDTYVNNVIYPSFADTLREIPTIHDSAKLLITHHSGFYTKLEHDYVEYGMYLTNDNGLSLLPKKTPIYIVKDSPHNRAFVRKCMNEPVLFNTGGKLYQIYKTRNICPIIAYSDGSIRITNLKDNGLWSITIPNEDGSLSVWKYPGCIITAKKPTNYIDITIITQVDSRFPKYIDTSCLKYIKYSFIAQDDLSKICTRYAIKIGILPNKRAKRTKVSIDYENTIIETTDYRMNLLQYMILDKSLTKIETTQNVCKNKFNIAFETVTQGIFRDVYDINALYVTMYQKHLYKVYTRHMAVTLHNVANKYREDPLSNMKISYSVYQKYRKDIPLFDDIIQCQIEMGLNVK